ncbi:carbohydrate ABC transporter permease [Jingyaoa shaoxingensis]|uniref:Sugar ABC transporter permease n=1 Tax=Jingyaoa shaoxingensis TaxID=2763671 RepID=A0ABR7N9E9_9FIRM|nr:sugar ABC transporter permease [Jingyaoa shaoxingensis]MBC8573031.1 sugar ABC transporter permease [Jingyaoa shaoxingensis]
MEQQTEKVKKQNSFGSILNQWTSFLMLMPAIASLLIVSIYPTVKTIWMSFFDKSILKKEEPFIGLANYIESFSKAGTWQTIFNTLFFAIVSLVLGVSLAMLIATKLIKPYPLRGFFRAMFLIPWVTPPLVASIVWRFIFSENFSPINSILLKLHLIKVPVNFLGSTATFLGVSEPLIVLTIINVWSIFPFLMVMFIAGLQTVPQEIYEAARMDGAGKMATFWKITVPCIRPVITSSIVLELIWQFNNFNISYMVTNGGPLGLTKTMAVEVYQAAFTNYRYGYASALSIIMMLIALIPSIFYIRSSLKPEN